MTRTKRNNAHKTIDLDEVRRVKRFIERFVPVIECGRFGGHSTKKDFIRYEKLFNYLLNEGGD